jgi:hypothetical protein
MTWEEVIPHIEKAIADIGEMMQSPLYALYGEILQQHMAVMMYRLLEAKRRATIEKELSNGETN